MSFVWLIIGFAAGLGLARFLGWKDLPLRWPLVEPDRQRVANPNTVPTLPVSQSVPSVTTSPASPISDGATASEPKTALATSSDADACAPEAAASAAGSKKSDDLTPTRAVRLRQLCNDMAMLTENIAHPRELSDEPQFKEMVRILADSEMPFDDVKAYVFGNSWPHSCAALQAMQSRDDGDRIVDVVIDNLNGLGIWQIAYALDLLATKADKCPAGSVLLHHESWWTDNVMVRQLFAGYFDKLNERGVKPYLGDAAKTATDHHPQIRAFLTRLQHPIGDRLAAELPVSSDASQTDTSGTSD